MRGLATEYSVLAIVSAVVTYFGADMLPEGLAEFEKPLLTAGLFCVLATITTAMERLGIGRSILARGKYKFENRYIQGYVEDGKKRYAIFEIKYEPDAPDRYVIRGRAYSSGAKELGVWHSIMIRMDPVNRLIDYMFKGNSFEDKEENDGEGTHVIKGYGVTKLHFHQNFNGWGTFINSKDKTVKDVNFNFEELSEQLWRECFNTRYSISVTQYRDFIKWYHERSSD